MTSRSLAAMVCLLASTLACSSADDAVKAGEKAARNASQQAMDASKNAASSAMDASKNAAGELADSAVDRSKKAAGDLMDATASGAKALFADLRGDGELSASAKQWLRSQASDATTIEGVLARGVQLAPVAIEAAKVLADAVDSDTAIEPIFQAVAGDTREADAAIGGMPRVEVIDGLTVGFKQMDRLDSGHHVKQRGYLVMWRRGDHLVGFVYRSTRTIDLAKLVAQTPRLVALTQSALDA